jgi:hypothetical protein
MQPTDLYEETDAEWYPYEDGRTINQLGGQGGYVLRDEELGDPEDPEAADARLTLEQGRADNPGFFLTATIYGWMLTTVKRATQADANIDYDAMHVALTRLVGLLPYEEDGPKRIEAKARLLTDAIAAFESRFA